MNPEAKDLRVDTLGECGVPTPISGVHFVREGDGIVFQSERDDIEFALEGGGHPLFFEKAGPRREIFFDPSGLKCGIVTCGGICPGLNDVIRAIVMSLHHRYGVRKILGFRYGYEGLSSRHDHEPLVLTPDTIKDIHHDGGTLLGSSRGPQDPADMVDTLEKEGVRLLFAIGGDGTLRGAGKIAEEIEKRDAGIGVIGVPKTIDNDISCMTKSFGFETASSEACRAVNAAHVEASGARNGIGLVKLMGRHSGFIAAYATLACAEVNFCLVPEVPFSMEGFLAALEKRLARRGHAVVAVAEGAGQDLLKAAGGKDASGNVVLGDVGHFLCDGIKGHFKRREIECTLKYIDPSYTIRSMPANPHDSVFCLLLGQNAVHAGMAGKTGMVVGFWRSEFTHVPIAMAVRERKRIDPKSWIWNAVLASTGQPANMT